MAILCPAFLWKPVHLAKHPKVIFVLSRRYLLPPAYVVLQKGNVLVMSVCLFTGGPIWPLLIMLLVSHSPPPTTTTRTPASCHPTSTRGPPSPSLIIWTLGTPTTWKCPPATPPHSPYTHLSASEQLVFNFKAFFFQCPKATSELQKLCFVQLCVYSGR